MHLKNIALRFNISNFFVYCCLLAFSILLSLRAGNIILWSFGVVFLPLWLWKLTTFLAAILGTVYWVRKKRKDTESRSKFIIMVFSTLEQFLLFLGELLIAVNLDRSGVLSWGAIFTPFYLLVVFSSVSCILNCLFKRMTNVELEILGTVNLFQLIFLAVRLDERTQWKWSVVLIPTWILLVIVALLMAIYVCLQCCHSRSEGASQQDGLARTFRATNATLFSVILVCFTIFLALLVSYLDGNLDAPVPAIFVPLHLCILLLFPTVLTRQPANTLWFGLHRNIVDIALELSPFFKEYLNISWTKEDLRERPILPEKGSSKVSSTQLHQDGPISEVEYTYEDIMMPD